MPVDRSAILTTFGPEYAKCMPSGDHETREMGGSARMSNLAAEASPPTSTTSCGTPVPVTTMTPLWW